MLVKLDKAVPDVKSKNIITCTVIRTELLLEQLLAAKNL